MTISRRPDYVTDDILVHDELNRWSINGSPQFLTNTTMSGATTQLFAGVFNLYPATNYSHFKIIISNFRTSVGGLTLNMKLHSTTSGLSGSTYDQAYQQVSTAGGLAYFGGTGLSSWTILRNSNSFNHYAAVVDVFSPSIALVITGISKISGSANDWSTSGGRHGNSNAFDGFELSLSAAGTMSGVVSVYALRNGSA